MDDTELLTMISTETVVSLVAESTARMARFTLPFMDVVVMNSLVVGQTFPEDEIAAPVVVMINWTVVMGEASSTEKMTGISPA